MIARTRPVAFAPIPHDTSGMRIATVDPTPPLMTDQQMQIAALRSEIDRARQGIDGNLAKIDRSLAKIARLTSSTTSCDTPRDVP